MKIKSLLLGSAAALVAVSGARAADAVVIPEPEMVEYVRVCDTYGTGYYYIPGTETCLFIGGFVRYEMNFTNAGIDAEGVVEGPGAPFEIDGDGDWGKRSEIELNIIAKNETELGTLTSHIQLAYDNNPRAVVSVGSSDDDSGADFFTQGNALGVKQAFIQLAGLTIGKKTTWWDWQPGMDGDGLMSGGPGELGMVAYTVNAGGFGWTLALEEDESGDYMPDVVLDVNGNVGAIMVHGGVAYNESEEAFTAKIMGGYDFGPAVFRLGYQYSESDNLGAEYLAGFEHVVGADLAADLTEKLSARVGGQYGFGDGPDSYKIGAGINYKVVSGFDIDARVNYQDFTDTPVDTDGIWGGRIRFTRTF